MSITILVATCLWLVLGSSFAGANSANINCLRTIKAQVGDPNDYLSSWVFGNNTAGYICKFTGVTCWHDDENKILSISLSGFGLTGGFPHGIKECSDLTGLDLSRNNFSGPLPPNITSFIPLLTVLDVSYNNFSGEIPLSVSNITFLNTLSLQHNQFTGGLPPGLELLRRLTKFSVADNLLSGPVPNFKTVADNLLSGPVPNFNSTLKFGVESFAGNPGLCGQPLKACVDLEKEELMRLGKTCAAVTAAIFAPVGAYLGWFFTRRKEKKGDVRRRTLIFHINE